MFQSDMKEEIMSRMLLFLCGLFFGNGIPHFINGMSGKITRHPFVYRWLPFVPNSLFNVFWGFLSFAFALVFYTLWQTAEPGAAFSIGFNGDFLLFCAGALATALFLSVYFIGGGW